MSDYCIGYGTYGLQSEDLFLAIPRLGKIGYRSIELTVADGWSAAPTRLDPAQRARLRETIQASGFRPPVLMDLLAPLAPETTPKKLSAQVKDACVLANDLNFEPGAKPVFTSTLGPLPAWDAHREAIVEKIGYIADLCSHHGVIFAVEPHVGSAFDRPEKALWAIEALARPNLRLNMDVSHFLAMGLDIPRVMEQLIPHAIYAHVKEVEGVSETEPKFLLPGQGGFDYAAYFKKLRSLGYGGFVVVEVSGQIWRRSDYKPWEAAESSFRVLQAAMRQS